MDSVMPDLLILKELAKNNKISETLVWHEEVKIYFKQLKIDGCTAREAFEILAEQFHTSESNINKIIYAKNKKYRIYT